MRAVANRTLKVARLLAGSLVLSLVVLGCKRGPSTSGSASAQAEVSGPKIDFDNALHDFGVATEGDKLTHAFTVKNSGTAPLVIDQVRTSCGCTAAALKTKEIPPGGTGQIEVTFDTNGRTGQNHKTITVTSNDKSKPSATLDIKATVEQLLGFEPRYVRLTADYGTAKAEKAWLVGKLVDQAKLSITKVDGDKDITVSPIEEKEGDKVKRGLEFKTKGDKVITGYGTVTLATGLPKPEQIDLRFSWNVAGNLQVVPNKLYFYVGHPTGRERVLRVWSKKQEFKLTRVRVVEGPFKAVLDKPDSTGKYQVKVTLNEPPAGKEAAEIKDGKLELLSNDPIEAKKIVELSARPPAAMGRPPMFPSGRPGMPPGPMGGPPPPPPPPAAPAAPSAGAH
jgi:hypothetical protein